MEKGYIYLINKDLSSLIPHNFDQRSIFISRRL